MENTNILYDFRKVEIPAAVLKITISRASMEQKLKEIAERFLTIEEVTGSIQQGDIVRLKLESSLEEYQNEDTALSIGKGYYPEELENGLVGQHTGMMLELTLDGAPVKATILSVKRRNVPTLTDEMTAKLGWEGVSDIPSCKEAVKQQLVEVEKRAKNNAIWLLVSKKLLEKSSLSVSEDALQKRVKQMLSQFDEVPEQEREKALLNAAKAKTMDEAMQVVREKCIENEKQCMAGMLLAQEKNICWNEATYEDAIKKYVALGMDEQDVRSRLTYDDYLAQQPISFLSDEILAYFDKKYVVELGE